MRHISYYFFWSNDRQEIRYDTNMTNELIAAVGGTVIAVVTGIFSFFTAKVRNSVNENYSLLKSIDHRTENIDRKLDQTSERLAAHEGWHRGHGDEI